MLQRYVIDYKDDFEKDASLKTYKKKEGRGRKIPRRTSLKKSKKERDYKSKIKRYKTYMTSSSWFVRRSEFFRDNEKVCAACGSEEYLTVHHITYVNIGRESDEDLCILCDSCHKEYHKNYMTSRRTTKSFIKKKHNEQERRTNKGNETNKGRASPISKRGRDTVDT